MLTFADIRGHGRAVDVVRRARAAGRLHHAYLLVGPQGVGKRTFAEAAARFINCENDGDDACGTCRACRLIAAHHHPDVHFVEPDGRWIKIEQVRELHGRTRFRPHEARRRIVIIDPADAMRDEAANALLKTLEEPGGETLFLVITASPQRLLSTVRSRCQPLRFGRLDDADVAALLEADGVSAEDAVAAARLSAGSPGAARAVLDSPVFSTRAEASAALVQALAGGPGPRVTLAESLASDRSEIADWLTLARALYRDAAVRAAGAAKERIVYRDQLEAIDALAAGASPTRLADAVSAIEQTERRIDGNVHPRLALESLLLGLPPARARVGRV